MNNKIKIFSWALFDFANTIFAANIVSLYFPLWVTVQKNASDKFYILPYYFSMLIGAFILPFFGVLSDNLKRYSLFLVFFTSGCIILTALIGLFDNLFIGVIFFGIANLLSQTATNVFYPALLPQICPQDKIAKVSSLGVALGYVGTITGLFTAKLFIKHSHYDKVFFPTAVLFLIFSLPCFIFIKDKKETENIPDFKIVLKEAIRKLAESINTVIKNKMALKFFLAVMLAINGINAVLLNMGVYGRKVIGLFDWELPIFIIISTTFAFIGSLVFGFVVEWFGPKRTLSFILIGWVLILSLISLINNKVLFWVIGPSVGVLLSGTWVSLRPFIIKLSSQDRMGEVFGISGLAGICGSLISPPIWLFIITIFNPLGLVKYRIAVFVLAILIALGCMVLQGVKEEKFFE